MRWTLILLLAALAWPFAFSSAFSGTAEAAEAGAAQSLPPGIKVPITDPPLPLGNVVGRRPDQDSDRQNAVQFLNPAQVTVAAERPAVVDLEFRVRTGLHINSHTPREKTLVPTRLALVEDRGFKIAGVDFPPGSDYAFAFSPKEKVNVYTGGFTLQAHLTAQPGEHTLEGLLHYQACDVNACMPPRTLPISIRVLAK